VFVLLASCISLVAEAIQKNTTLSNALHIEFGKMEKTTDEAISRNLGS
jgi:hypothetical protein